VNTIMLWYHFVVLWKLCNPRWTILNICCLVFQFLQCLAYHAEDIFWRFLNVAHIAEISPSVFPSNSCWLLIKWQATLKCNPGTLSLLKTKIAEIPVWSPYVRHMLGKISNFRPLSHRSTTITQWRGERYDGTSTRTGPLQSKKK